MVRKEAARALETLVPIYKTTRCHIEKASSRSYNGSFYTAVFRTLIIIFSNVPLHELSFIVRSSVCCAVLNSIRAHLKRKIAWPTYSSTQ